MDYVRYNSTLPVMFLMVSSVDHISPGLGLTVTLTISKNGGPFIAPTGTVTEIGSGWYRYMPSALDTDTLGPWALHATAATADPSDILLYIVDGFVTLGPTQTTNIVGSMSGSVGSVVDAVTCSGTTTTTTTCCCKKKCKCC